MSKLYSINNDSCVRYILAKKKEGLSYKEIAKDLVAEGYRNKHGRVVTDDSLRNFLSCVKRRDRGLTVKTNSAKTLVATKNKRTEVKVTGTSKYDDRSLLKYVLENEKISTTTKLAFFEDLLKSL